MSSFTVRRTPPVFRAAKTRPVNGNRCAKRDLRERNEAPSARHGKWQLVQVEKMVFDGRRTCRPASFTSPRVTAAQTDARSVFSRAFSIVTFWALP